MFTGLFLLLSGQIPSNLVSLKMDEVVFSFKLLIVLRLYLKFVACCYSSKSTSIIQNLHAFLHHQASEYEKETLTK